MELGLALKHVATCCEAEHLSCPRRNVLDSHMTARLDF